MPKITRTLALSTLAIAAAFSAAGAAQAADRFKVTSVDCEQFFLWRHTPVIHYDIVDERKGDYETDMGPDYFRQAASRTVEFCDRTSFKPETPLAAPRRIRGIWFQSNDGQFKILFDVDRGAVDASAGVTNRIGDRYAARRQADARHEAQLEEIRTREARAQEVRAAEAKAAQDKAAAEAKAAQDKVAAENAREQLFFDRMDLQVSRLGTQVSPADFALVADVRTNPFHFRKLGLAVVRTQFSRMVTDKVALFGNEFAPVFVHIADVDRFTRSGETVMLALKVVERGEVERCYGSLPEIILSALKAEPIYGDYVGAYTCPGEDCNHVFDPPPPT